MSAWNCSKCGASIAPVPATESTVTCGYCKSVLPVSSFVGEAHTAAARIEHVMGRALEEHAAKQKRALHIALAVSTAVLVVIVGLFVNGGSSAPEPPPVTSSPAAAVEATPEPPPVEATPSAVPAVPTLPQPSVTFGGQGTGPGMFDRACCLALGPDGHVFVADRTKRVQEFDASGALLRTILTSTNREATNELDIDITDIQGIAVGPDGALWVSLGYDLQRIDVGTGRVSRRIAGHAGRTCFRDVDVDARGHLHALSACTATDKYALLHLDPNGREVVRVSEPPSYEDSATGRFATDGAGRWYVPFGYQSEIRILETDGSVFTRFGRRGEGSGEFSMFSIGPVVLDVAGRVFVRDSDELDVFDASGHSLGTYPFESGRGPIDFAIERNGAIWVLDGQGRVARYPAFVAPN